MQVALWSNLALISGFSIAMRPAWPQGNGCFPLAKQDYFIEQSKSFCGWCSSILGNINTFPPGIVSLEHFYFESGSSLGTVQAGDYLHFQVGCVHDDMFCLLHNLCSVWQSTSMSIQHKVALLIEGASSSKPCDVYVHSLSDNTHIRAAISDGDEANLLCSLFSSLFSSLISGCKVFLFAPQVICYASMTCSINCAMSTEEHALSSAPPKQLLGVCVKQPSLVTTEEESGMGGPQCHSPHSVLQSQSINNSSQLLWPSTMSLLGSPAVSLNIGLHSKLSPSAIASAILFFQQLVASFIVISCVFMVISGVFNVFTELSSIVFTGLSSRISFSSLVITGLSSRASVPSLATTYSVCSVALTLHWLTA